MNNDKYIFFDIDGTIYSPRLQIPDSTKEAISLLKRNGHHPVICTGRTKIMILDKILALGFDGILAGAGAYGEWEQKILYHKLISGEEAEELVKTFREYGFHPYAEGAEGFYYDPESNTSPRSEIKRIFSIENEDFVKPFQKGQTDICKVSGAFAENCDTEGLKQKLGGKYHLVDHFHVLMESFPLNTSKGNAIRRLLSGLGADRENTYAYGDSLNDLEMIQAVRYGVCMGNGDPRLKERAPYCARRMDEDGIYFSLKEFGLI